jgi:hypothetical protein
MAGGPTTQQLAPYQRRWVWEPRRCGYGRALRRHARACVWGSPAGVKSRPLRKIFMAFPREQTRAVRSHLQGGGSAHHCSEMVYLWYKQGILCTGACGALAALVSRREGAPVGASGVTRECGKGLPAPEHIASVVQHDQANQCRTTSELRHFL